MNIAEQPQTLTAAQFMVKDSRKYASTGGWVFAQFNHGKPVDAAVQNTCFSCHETVKVRDFVFNRYAHNTEIEKVEVLASTPLKG